MMFVGFFFLMLLTGGNTSSSDQQQMVNQSLDEMPGNISSSELTEPYGDQLAFNQSSEESSGGNISSTEQPKLHGDKKKCRFQDVIDHLNLTKNKDLYTMDRPVLDHRRPTWVFINMVISAILDVKETDQTLTTYIYTDTEWNNELITWKPDDFCGIRSILIPKEALWMPDITIEEMIEADKSPPSPYLEIFHGGHVTVKTEQVVISTCRMHVYKFPFDTQSCTISFKSIMYSDKELTLFCIEHKTWNTEISKALMKTQYEWKFVDLTATNETVDSFGPSQTRIIYTINMKRKSILYIANFLLPVFFFLCLDLASFLISDTGGEKLGYKVTVLLAVTVMQLILNEILPSSSNRIPLIVVYCMGVFSLMLLSLLETIVVMHLIDKDSTTQDNEPDGEQTLKVGRWNERVNCFRGMKQCTHCASVSDVSSDETPSVTKEGSSCQLTKALEKVSHELGEIEQRVSQLSIGKEEEKPGSWTRLAKKINRVFAVCYVTAVILFLAAMCSAWAPEK